MSITTDLSGYPILDVDYGHSSMSGFNGENYFFWTYEEYVNNYVNKVKGKDVLKAKSQKRHKQTTPIIHYKDARK